MLVNKLADPADFDKPEYQEIKKWCEDKVQEAYHELHLPVTYSAVFRAWEYAQMFLNIPFTPDSRILDLGTSESIRPLWYAEHGVKDYVTFDMGHEAERHHLYEHYYPDGRIKVDVGDMHYLPYADNSFDIVLSVSVVEHLKDPKQALKEMIRIVKPGGYIGLTTDFSRELVDVPKSGREFDDAALQDVFINTLEEAGFKLIGETDFHNVDLNIYNNRVVDGNYTFASLVFKDENKA